MRRLLLLFLFALPAFPQASNIPNTISIQSSGAPSGACGNNFVYTNSATNDFYNCVAGAWNKVSSAGGAGTVTSIATTSPITGGTITGTGTIACAGCVTSSSPGVGLAHFAGSTQAVTSSAVNLAGADVTGNLPVTNLGSGTSASSSTFWRGDGTWAAASGLLASVCSNTGVSDTLTANGNFATTCSISGNTATLGATYDIYFTDTEHVTSGSNFQYELILDSGALTGFVGHSAALGDFVAFAHWQIHISSIGASGTAMIDQQVSCIFQTNAATAPCIGNGQAFASVDWTAAHTVKVAIQNFGSSASATLGKLIVTKTN